MAMTYAKDFTYTRAGAFKLNKDNFIVDASGNYLQGFLLMKQRVIQPLLV